MPEALLIFPNAIVRPRMLEDVACRAVRLPQERALVHLQFRRFAGCPICNPHLRSFARRHGELEAAGIREIVLFHSPAAGGLPDRAGRARARLQVRRARR